LSSEPKFGCVEEPQSGFFWLRNSVRLEAKEKEFPKLAALKKKKEEKHPESIERESRRVHESTRCTTHARTRKHAKCNGDPDLMRDVIDGPIAGIGRASFKCSTF